MHTSKAAAVILTFNEQAFILETINNISQYFETVFVIDSLSTDNTVAIAEEAGAQVLKNKFVNFSSQRNFAIENIERDFDWLFFLDADEKIDVTLGDNIKNIICEKPIGPTAYTMRRDNFFLGEPLKYVSGKDRQTRLFGQFKDLRYSGEVHECVGLSGYDNLKISGRIIHSDTASLSKIFAKTNNYTTLEVEKKKRYSKPASVIRLLSVPIRTFLKAYILRLGFLDGYRGFIWAGNSAIYKFILISKQIEDNFKK